ncbi:RNA polymerase sigma factor (sigma-70 family) [Sphingobacterium allocomposti]|uniref:RNA polymerase sigma factor (Sigma-70 family) n=1 Tax=Sphingobacterium allocomposti TaxID=415956 RepID=A0A5S5DS12_9SPHI|nr:sigma factor-like helix-turn-helix DNA-binding protein [Sphingobacterium composti Yoo et al. 2007 non Ten et al. 2007]TYP98677.1 RNA polymerase sigma factor (sigma-70 family) [Sphingobacterium composti Yoo et al. 2007 non Ten et al. 2007]HLS96246.1 sigma factor-like helix-turn-helix DNA-binding protein [Sphingobacterium sp.]
MINLSKQMHVQQYIHLLQSGQERGLDFFYRRHYGYFFFRAEKATQDVCAAESITQEAFLRLWLFRDQVKSETCVFEFLKTQVKLAIKTFYSKTRNRFYRSLIRLDGIEDYQEFLLGYEIEEGEETDLVYLEQLEAEKKEKLAKLNGLLPHLNEEQQLFIRLCLKYDFNYERIAYYLGGISDYEVGLRIEKIIGTLRSIFDSSQKMEALSKRTHLAVQGEFNEQQAEIFRMRYDLQLSFDEIADALNLSGPTVRKLFIEAHAKIKRTKQTA